MAQCLFSSNNKLDWALRHVQRFKRFLKMNCKRKIFSPWRTSDTVCVCVWIYRIACVCLVPFLTLFKNDFTKYSSLMAKCVSQHWQQQQQVYPQHHHHHQLAHCFDIHHSMRPLPLLLLLLLCQVSFSSGFIAALIRYPFPPRSASQHCSPSQRNITTHSGGKR